MKKALELFKGTGSFGKVAKKMGYIVVSVDIEQKYNPDLLIDILRWDYKDYYKKYGGFDFIWASPPCNTYSPLAYPLKERNTKTAEPFSERAKLGTIILYKTLEIINFFLSKNPKLKYVIENPKGMMRNDKFMRKLYMANTLYCSYGDIKRKSTDFFSNYEISLNQSKKCNKPTKGVVDLPLNKRYSIPSKLIRTILEQS